MAWIVVVWLACACACPFRLNLNEGREFNVSDWVSLYSVQTTRDHSAVLAGDNFGMMYTVDPRAPGAADVNTVHRKNKVTCVSCNPRATHMVVTCGNDHHMSLWDLRKMEQKPVDDYLHPRVVNSAYFSPVRAHVCLLQCLCQCGRTPCRVLPGLDCVPHSAVRVYMMAEVAQITGCRLVSTCIDSACL